MAKNKAAKIQSWGTYVYKNSRYKDINPASNARGYIEQYIYIPCMSNIKTGVLDKMTKQSVGNSNYYYIIEDVNSNSILDFGDNEITFMNCNREENGKNISIVKTEVDNIDYSVYGRDWNNIFDPDGYALSYPLQKCYQSSSVSQGYTRYDGFLSNFGLYASSGNYQYHSSYAGSRFIGNKKKNLSSLYNPDEDCFLIPFSTSMPYYTDTNRQDIYPDGKNAYLGCNISKPGVGSFGMSYPFIQLLSYSQPYNWRSYNGRYEYAIITDSSAKNSSLDIIIPVNYGYGGMIGYGEYYYKFEHKFSLPYSSINKKAFYSYALIYDDEKDEYNIMYMFAGEPAGKMYTVIFPINTDAVRIFNVCTNSYPSDFDLKNVFSEIVGDLIDSDKVPKPDGELFNDNGPDIDGAGDPYNTDEFNNIGSSVGGDADSSKDLNSVDATPNTSFNNFMQATGFFGSYVLSNADLVEYTNTLKMLYSHADDVFFGEAAGLQADRITKNTIGLHMLPLTIPSTDYADTIFSMGNVGIAATDNYASYVTGNNYAHANYLTKLTRTFNVPLGTIKHNYDNFLDFAPYSSASLYIPYIGKVQLPINLVQSTSSDSRPLRLEFRVDYTSGDFMAILFCNMKGVDVALSHWNGNCARPVKVSVDDDSSAIIAGANRIASMFSFGASGSIGAQTSRGAGDFSSSSDPVGHNSMDFKNHTEGINSSYHEGHSAGKSASASFRMPSMPSSVTTNQHMIGNGSATGELGYLGIQDIVLTVERPIWWKPYDYGNLVGYPTKKVAKLASVKGFARVSDAHVRCKATATEKNEIATLLSEGVIF